MDGSGAGGNEGDRDRQVSSGDGRLAVEEVDTAALDSLPEPAFVLDEDAGIVYANKRLAATAGRDREELDGRALESLVAGDDVPRLVDLIAAATHGEASTATVGVERADGRRVPHRLTAGPFRDADGEVVGVIGTARDVSERAAGEEALEEKRARLERFASILSHDLRNPLAVAEGYLHLAREETDAPYLDEIQSAHDRMGELVEDLLTLATEGSPLDEPSTVDLAGVATDAWTGVSTGEASLVVRDDLGTVEGDRGQLRQLFENLFRNAVEHGSTSPRSQAREDTVEHGSTGSQNAGRSGDAVEHAGDGSAGVEMEQAEKDEDEKENENENENEAGVVGDDGAEETELTRGAADAGVEGAADADGPGAAGRGVTVTVGPTADGFYVADDGPGLPEDLDDPFRDGVTTKPGGTGLGLAIVESVAAVHGWDVEAGTSAEGGARFDIRFR